MERGKLSVAYTDFRKPLQDNLFYLEWMLADWPGFLARFRQGPEHLDLTKVERDPAARNKMRTGIIAQEGHGPSNKSPLLTASASLNH